MMWVEEVFPNAHIGETEAVTQTNEPSFLT